MPKDQRSAGISLVDDLLREESGLVGLTYELRGDIQYGSSFQAGDETGDGDLICIAGTVGSLRPVGSGAFLELRRRQVARRGT